MSVVAAIDCGTNSVRLLISADGRDVLRRMEIVRLGQGVDRTGRLDPAAIERTRVALAGYAAEITAHGVQHVRMVATSATRDAENRDDFVAVVRTTLGVDPEVVTGDEEARLSYAGATAGLTQGTSRGTAGPVYPLLVADVGGGSTELIVGDRPGRDGVRAARSLDIGCVRLTERRLAADPPTPEQVAAAEADIAAALATLADGDPPVPVSQAATFVGLAGSVTTIAAFALGLRRYDSERIHLARIPAADVIAACADLLAMSKQQRTALPFMHPGRVDVIGGGALVVRAVLAASGCDSMIASEHDILDGIAASIPA